LLKENFKSVEFYKQDGIDYIHRIQEPELGFVIGVCR